MAKTASRQKTQLALSVISPAAATATGEDGRGREAYQHTLKAAKALRAKELIAVNLDIPTAVTTALRALPAILALRSDIVRDLPNFDIRNVDLLETYTLATAHAHAMRAVAATSPEPLAALKAQCGALGDTLYADAVALSKRGLLNGAELKPFNPRARHKRLAFELRRLTSLLRRNWDTIASRTALLPSELEQAESFAEQLLSSVGPKGSVLAAATQSTQQRQRNFTLFVRAYGQVRRAISYLRWDQSVDRIVPSLYAARHAGRAKKVKLRPVPRGSGAVDRPG